MDRVYVCHANRPEDQAAVALLTADLKDKYTLLTTPLPADRLTAELRNVRAVIFLISTAAYVDPAYCAVLEAALAQKRTIIPVEWDANDTGKDFKHQIDLQRWGDTLAQVDERIGKLRAKIGRINWILYREYHTAVSAANTTAQQTARDRQRRRIERAIETPIPTWIAMISYSRRNLATVQAIKDQIEEADLGAVWLDKEAIPPAADWQQSIYDGIAQSQNIVCFVSNDWLVSYPCWLEYIHAKQINKRIIPIWLEPPDSAQIRQKLTDNPWQELSIAQTLEQIDAVQNDLEQLNALALTAPIAIPQLEARFQADRAHIERHTQYLIRASTGERLRWYELPTYWLWQQRSHTHAYPPSDRHRALFRHSLLRVVSTLLFVLFVLAITVLSVTTTIASANAEAAAARADSEAARADTEVARRQVVEVRADEAERRLQIQAVFNNRLETPLPTDASGLLLAFDALWAIGTDADLWRVPLNGLTPPERISSGRDVGSAAAHAGFVWVTSADGTLTRITPDTRLTSATVPGIRNPGPPLFTRDRVWMASATDGSLIGYRLESLTDPVTYMIGLNTRGLIASADALWYIPSNTAGIARLDAASGAIITLGLPGEPRQLLATADRVIALLPDRVLALDLSTGVIAQETALAAPLTALQAVGGWLWGQQTDGSGFVRLDPHTLTLTAVAQPGITALYPAAERVWTISAAGLTLYSADLTAVITLSPPSDPDGLLPPLAVGTADWFVQPASGTVTVIDGRTGATRLEVQPCAEPGSPVYDGANVWFACAGASALVALPAELRFYGEQSVVVDGWTHRPHVSDDGVLWFTQHGTGRLLAHDPLTGTTRSADFGSPILPLTAGMGYLWTAIPATGELIRIQPDRTPDALTIDRQWVGTGIESVNVFDQTVWVQQLPVGEEAAAFLTLIDAASLLMIGRDTTLDRLGSLYYHDGVIWSSVLDYTTSYLQQVDPRSAAILQREPMPVTPYAALRPTFAEGLLWFPAVVPPLRDLPTVMGDLWVEADRIPNAEYPMYLLGIDPATRTAIHSYRLPTSTSEPHYAAGYLWLWQTAPVITDNVVPGTGNGIIAVRISDGQIGGPWSVCAQDDDLALMGAFAWLACRRGDNSFGVFTAQQAIAQYDDIGQNANRPAAIGTCVAFTFADTNTAALFSITTGDLIRTYRVGSRPLAPVAVGDRLYIYNAASDTLQQIDLRSTECIPG